MEGLPEGATRDSVQVEVGGFGARPIYVTPAIASLAEPHVRINPLAAPGVVPDAAVIEAALFCTQIVVPVPLGLDAGKVDLRVMCADVVSETRSIELCENGQW